MPLPDVPVVPPSSAKTVSPIVFVPVMKVVVVSSRNGSAPPNAPPALLVMEVCPPAGVAVTWNRVANVSVAGTSASSHHWICVTSDAVAGWVWVQVPVLASK